VAWQFGWVESITPFLNATHTMKGKFLMLWKSPFFPPGWGKIVSGSTDLKFEGWGECYEC
jgi:hypothetical protein